MERPDVRPEEPHLLLARSDNLLALAEGDPQDVGDARRGDGAPATRLINQHNLTHAAGWVASSPGTSWIF